MKPNLVSYEVIEKVVGGDTASLLAVQQHYKPFIGYLSNGDTDLKEVLNVKLLKAVLKFRIDYQAEKSQIHEKPSRVKINGYAALDGFPRPCCLVVKRVKAVNRFRPL